jgi:phosphonate transport system substrate-binding protein
MLARYAYALSAALVYSIGYGANGAAAQSKPTLVFTAIPDQDETRLVQRFTAAGKYLEGKLGVPVKYLPVKSYAASVTAFKNNQVQLAWFGGLSGVQARLAVPGSQAIAQGAEDVQFKSHFIANTATGIKPIAKLDDTIKGKTFTFGSRGSTSGRLFPEHYLREAFHMAPDMIFSRVGFSGDHSRTIQLVQSGAYQIGAVNYLVWDAELAAGKIDPNKVAVIWTTPSYPDYNWSIRGDVDKTFGAGFQDKVKAAILAIDDKTLLKHFERSKFIPAKNEDYKAIEDVGKLTGLIN